MMKLKRIFLAGIVAGVVFNMSPMGMAAQPSVPVNATCIVTPREKLDGKTFVKYHGKTYGFCCKSCVKKFRKNPEKYITRFAASQNCIAGVCTDKKGDV